MKNLVQILVDGYLLPNGGTYKAGDLVFLTIEQYNSINKSEFGVKVQDAEAISATDHCLVKINANNYRLANGGTYNDSDLVALKSEDYYAIPFGDRAGVVSLISKAPVLSYNINFDTRSSIRSVPRNFLGVGTEVWDVLRWTDQQFVYNALSALNVDGNNAPTFRLGGGSADGAWWNPTGQPKPAGVTYDYNVSYTNSLSKLLTDTGMKIIVCLNMGNANTQYAIDWAQAAQTNLPSGSIKSFQIGNEPDNWAAAGVRSSTYSQIDYIGELTTFVSAVTPHIGSIPLTLPSYSSFTWFDATKFASLDAAGGANFKEWDQHRYPLIASSNPTINDLLDPVRRTYMNGNFASIVSYGDAHGKTVRASELNTVGQGGMPGVSNSQAGALWLLRAMLDLAQIGVSAVNVFGMHDRSYSPINVNATTGAWNIQSPYYAMIMFALATQHDSTFISFTASGLPATLFLYGLRGSDNKYRIVAINVDDSTDCSVSFRLPTAGLGIKTILTAPSLAATSGITLAGQTYDGSSNGRPLGRLSQETVPSLSGNYKVSVPAHSALLLEVPVV